MAISTSVMSSFWALLTNKNLNKAFQGGKFKYKILLLKHVSSIIQTYSRATIYKMTNLQNSAA